jgi:hypothetical protein
MAWTIASSALRYAAASLVSFRTLRFIRLDLGIDLGFRFLAGRRKILHCVQDDAFGVSPNLSLRWHWNRRAAFLARAQLLVAGELLINLPDWVGAVITDRDGSLVNFVAAVVAEPFKVIDFAGSAFCARRL